MRWTLLLLLAAPAWGQGTKADYRRALSLAQRAVAPRRIAPQWIDGHRCWYRAGGRTVLVDAQAGSKGPAFDHDAVAAALSKATGVKQAPDTLALRAMAADGDALLLWLAGDLRAWRVAGREVAPRPLASVAAWRLGAATADARSGRGGRSSGVLFVNPGSTPVELFWVMGNGQLKSYGKIAPGKQRWQQTYAGHVWAVQEGRKPTVRYVATTAPRVAVIAPGAARPPRRRSDLSPDGRWRVRVVRHQVVLESVQLRKRLTLTKDGSPRDYYRGRAHWSPDSRYFVVMRTRPGERRTISFVESRPKGGGQPKVHTMRYDKPGDRRDVSRPVLFDAGSGAVRAVDTALFPTPYALSHVRWSRDSRRFTFRYNQRGHQLLRVIAVDAVSGTARALIEERSKTFVDYPKAHARWLPDGSVVWTSERDGWKHLYLFGRDGALVRQLTRGRWVVRSIDRIEGRRLWFWAGGINPGEDPYHLHYCRVSLDGGEVCVLTRGDGTHEVTHSPDRAYFVDRWSRVDLPPVAVLRRADGTKVCELDRAPARKGLPIRFVAKGRDGKTPIHGIIHRPSNFDPGRRYPVVEAIYAGPHGAHVPKAFRAYHGAQQTAELGLVVVQIDGMGTAQRGKRFHDVCWRNLGDAGFPDRVKWIKAASARYAWMDASRVGIYGGSAGGQNAMRALIAHHELYKVAVADCGCHDNRDDKIWWNELWMGHPIGKHYAASSNVDQAHRMQGKLLLIVGELDRNVDPASTMRVVDALIKADKDFDLLVIPGAGHGAAGTAYGRRRRMDFLVRHLLGVEPRAR